MRNVSEQLKRCGIGGMISTNHFSHLRGGQVPVYIVQSAVSIYHVGYGHQPGDSGNTIGKSEEVCSIGNCSFVIQQVFYFNFCTHQDIHFAIDDELFKGGGWIPGEVDLIIHSIQSVSRDCLAYILISEGSGHVSGWSDADQIIIANFEVDCIVAIYSNVIRMAG
ncbi:MAG: hypothetical protein BWY95_00424 [Bacteroidetes bacterium ADurb.BinA104]|nr:MAG: hypothetical protein BWY95_00424 [Bacteroidetes bacterium ADurb.BinA104]